MNLVLVSTPLQALIAEALLRELAVGEYDLIYSARSDLQAHRHYYARLAGPANRASYAAGVRAPSSSLRFLSRRITLRRFFDARYDRIFLASIDSAFFRSLLARNPRASVVTFDDGAANIFSGSPYHARRTFLGAVSEVILGCPSTQQVKDRIQAHYSIFRNQTNIVDPARLRFLPLWSDMQQSAAPGTGHQPSFFVGQPFVEAIRAGTLDASAPAALEAWLRMNPVDYYLVHPRESRPLTFEHGATHRSMSVAEEEIFTLAKGARPKVYGWFSSVLLNIPPEAADKVYLSIGSGPQEQERIQIMKLAGCTVEHA